jgi:DNA/RNA endonuclease YhcR with UshA esterase domain
MKRIYFRSFCILILAAGGLFIFGKNLNAATADHLVISEVQVAGATANDEFIEIYNPTTNPINIETWSIQYKGATVTTFYKKNFSAGASVPAHGWYLVSHNDYTGATTPDMSHSTFSMSGTGGHVFLVNNQTTLTSPNDPSIIDKIGYGAADSPEGAATGAPPTNQSIERKFGGDLGNGEDTNDNFTNFALQAIPNPQNIFSPPKPDLPGPVCGNSICEAGEDWLTCPADCSSPPAEPGVGDVVVNEFVSDPAEGNEWIELYNKQTFDINLSGWTLEDGVGTIAILSGTITASGVDKFKVFEMSSNKLNNDGDIIKLKKSDGTIIDQVSYGNWDDGNPSNNAPKANDPNSTARKTDGSDTDSDITDFAVTSTLTKGASNIIVTPPSSSGGSTPPPSTPSSPPSWPVGSLLINEFVADPTDGADEWIEFYNSTNQSINLNDWTVEDGSETATTLSGSVPPFGFYVLEKPKGILNNTGDIIILKDPAGLVIDQVTYGDWDDGEKSDNAPTASDPNSVARKTDGQNTSNDFNDFVVAAPTKGVSNVGGIAQNASSAYSKNIIINEVLPNPKGDDSQNEFIELKNIGTTDIDLTGWKVGDASTKRYVVKTADFSSAILKPNEFFVLYRKMTGIALNNSGTESVKLFGPDGSLVTSIEYTGAVAEDNSYARENTEYFWTTTPTPGQENIITKINQAPQAVIFAPSEAEIGETILFDGSDSTDPDNDALTFFWNFGDGATANGVTMSHAYQSAGKFKIVLTVKDAEGTTNLAEHFIKITDPDNLSTAFPTNEQLIFINEILPNPEGSDDAEWIEILSLSLKPFDLSGWKLDDDEGGSRPYKIPDGTIINPGEYLVFKKEQTKLALNNTYDAARLLDPDGEIFFETSYDEAPEGASWARDTAGNFKWTTHLTPGAENIFQFKEKTAAKKTSSTSSRTRATKFIETTLEEIRNQDLGDGVKVTGQVIVEPGILGTQIFYIANDEACPGIQIYMYSKNFPELKLGDLVEVTGVLSESGGEKRVKVSQQSDIKVLENKEAPVPMPIKLSEVEEGFEGCLVSAGGEITEKSGSNVYFSDDDGELKIYFKSTLPFTKPNFKIGDQIETTGIVSQTKTGFRLLPRYETDLKIKPLIVSPTTLEIPTDTRGNQVTGLLGLAAGILGLTLVGLGIKTGIFGNWWKKIKGV